MSRQVFLSSNAQSAAAESVEGPSNISLSSRAERSAAEEAVKVNLSSRPKSLRSIDAVEGPAVYNFYRQPSPSNTAAPSEHFGAASLLSMLQERHPRTTRFLALLFFLAGAALFVRMM